MGIRAKIVSKKIKYLRTETEILECNYPLRLFNTVGLGVNLNELINSASPTFDNLEWDYYDLKLKRINYLQQIFPAKRHELQALLSSYFQDNELDFKGLEIYLKNLSQGQLKFYKSLQPFRKRSIGYYELSINASGVWQSTISKGKSFSQNTSDYRSIPRQFPPMEVSLLTCNQMDKITKKLAHMVSEIRPTVSKISITVHQVETVARPNSPASNSPEGIHQDGADYIVSALVLERKEISGGKSKIYSENEKNLLFVHELQKGEGIFQADRNTNLYHEVTNIHVQDERKNIRGFRRTLGFDINVLD